MHDLPSVVSVQCRRRLVARRGRHCRRTWQAFGPPPARAPPEPPLDSAYAGHAQAYSDSASGASLGGSVRALFAARSSIAAASAASAVPRARKCPPFRFWRRLAVPATLCMCMVSPVRVGVAASIRAPSGVARPASLLGPASDMRTSARAPAGFVCPAALLGPASDMCTSARAPSGVPWPCPVGCCNPSSAAAGPSVGAGSPASSSASSPSVQSVSELISGWSRSPSAAASSAVRHSYTEEGTVEFSEVHHFTLPMATANGRLGIRSRVSGLSTTRLNAEALRIQDTRKYI